MSADSFRRSDSVFSRTSSNCQWHLLSTAGVKPLPNNAVDKCGSESAEKRSEDRQTALEDQYSRPLLVRRPKQDATPETLEAKTSPTETMGVHRVGSAQTSCRRLRIHRPADRRERIFPIQDRSFNRATDSPSSLEAHFHRCSSYVLTSAAFGEFLIALHE